MTYPDQLPHKLPLSEMQAAPLSHEMLPNETMTITDFGAQPGHLRPQRIVDRNNQLLHEAAIPTVEIVVGTAGKNDKLDVCDVSQSPWQDEENGQVGHFTLVRWTQSPLHGDEYIQASVRRLYPGEMLTIGRDGIIGGERDGIPAPQEVSRLHAAVGIDGQGRLIIQNFTPTNSTHVRNLVPGHERSSLQNPKQPKQQEVPTAFVPLADVIANVQAPVKHARAVAGTPDSTNTVQFYPSFGVPTMNQEAAKKLPELPMAVPEPPTELAVGVLVTPEVVPTPSEAVTAPTTPNDQASEAAPRPALPQRVRASSGHGANPAPVIGAEATVSVEDLPSPLELRAARARHGGRGGRTRAERIRMAAARSNVPGLLPTLAPDETVAKFGSEDVLEPEDVL